MPLVSGTRLGPYEIVAPLGAGGMGEVYRAHDSRLNRDVAIKILPEHLSQNPELRERFEREARAISQLSHPHICVLHDIGKHDGADYLVLECLEGETLGARLRRGPLPPEQVLKYGSQIADALDKAHRRGVVHRDLKPDNVMLTKSGVKLLDFGLAKPLATQVGMSSSIVATMTHSPLTSEGTLVGTFQYMAPEQLEGKEADARSDIFALGCVLYEMSTGKRAFDGKSTASVVASIMNSEPAPLTGIAPLTPPALEWTIKKCMAKDPEERWQSVGDLASELRWIEEGGSRAGVAIPTAVRSRRKILRWVAVAAAAVAGIAVGIFLKPATAPLTLRVAVNLPSGTSLVPYNSAVLSPDGQWVVLGLADDQGRMKLWVRQLSNGTVLALDGTEGGVYPFWSPDSRFIGFFAADGKVRKIPAGGGPAEAVCDIWQVYGGTWGAGDVIVFATGSKGLYRVSASGGTPVRVPIPENNWADYRQPSFLPDGKHVLATSNAAAGGIFVVEIVSGEVKAVLPSESSAARYAEPGYLLFTQGDSLMAQKFDVRTLQVSGTAHRIAESVYNGPLSFSTDSAGLLLYQRAFQTQLTWFDSDGNKQSTVGEPGYISAPYISPNGKYTMVTVTDPRQNRQKLWLYDMGQGTATPFTFGEGNDQYPAWSPDSQQVAFSSNRGGQEDIYVKGVSGGSQEQVLNADPGDKEPDRWSSDGKYILFDYIGRKDTGSDVWALPIFGDRKPFAVVQSAANENWGTLSPDGKWVVYASDESGRSENYVVPFPGPGGKWQVSTTGGIMSFWPSGSQLFYVTPENHVVVVDIETHGTNLVVGKSRVILGGRAFGSASSMGIDPEGKRWLVPLPVSEPNASPLILTTNWTSALRH
jgi:eukaryotic-like serine/threonine-protein kinase